MHINTYICINNVAQPNERYVRNILGPIELYYNLLLPTQLFVATPDGWFFSSATQRLPPQGCFVYLVKPDSTTWFLVFL